MNGELDREILRGCMTISSRAHLQEEPCGLSSTAGENATMFGLLPDKERPPEGEEHVTGHVAADRAGPR